MSTYPGTRFNAIGGKIRATNNGPSTETLLIIGTAVDGPLNRPVLIDNAAQAQRVFGPARYSGGYVDPNTSTESGNPNGASLPLAIAQALSAGAGSIYAVRATGSFAVAGSAYSNQLDIRAQNPGRVYNSVVFTTSVTSTGSSGYMTVTVDQPAVKGGSFSSVFASGTTLGEVIDSLNADARNTTIYINRDSWPTPLDNAAVLLGSGSVTLTGGTNGTRAKGEDYATSVNGYANMLSVAETGTFDTLLGYKFKFDVAVLADIYLDDQVTNDSNLKYTTSIATDFVYWLDQMSSDVHPCSGVIGVKPAGIRDLTAYINYINNNLLSTTSGAWNSTLRWIKAGYFLYNGWQRLDPDGGVSDIGSRLSVAAGPDVVVNHADVGRYTTNIHVLYAALCTVLPPERAAVFTQLPGVAAYGTMIPGKYANKLVEGVGFDETNNLSGKGAYVVLIPNPRENNTPWVIFDDPTASARDEYFRNYQIVHLCNSIQSDLDKALGKFIGGSTDLASLAAMEAQVQNIMDGYVGAGAFRGGRGQGYDFKLTMNGQDQFLGVVRVFLEIAPATALRRIHFVVSIRNVTT